MNEKTKFTMSKSRLEAFSDGVLAIIITIMVLELKIPHGINLQEFLPIIPILLLYALSFAFIGIYWINHHHMIHASKAVNSKVLWANLHLLFWLSLVPFATTYMGENNFSNIPTMIYGVVLLMSGAAYNILSKSLIKLGGDDCPVAIAYKKDKKGKISLFLYFIAIPIAYFMPMISITIFVIVTLLWIVPEKRMEIIINEK